MLFSDDVKPKPFQLSASTVERFLGFCNIYSLAKKNCIVRIGDNADTLYFIIEGSASVIVEDEDDMGHEIILAYLHAGDFIGEMGLFYPSKTRAAYVRTRTKTKLAKISYRRLNLLFKNELKEVEADILRAMGVQLSQRLVRTNRKVSQLAFMDVSGRIARALLDMCSADEAVSHPDGTQLHLSRQELARVVGCSREMAGRVLKNMAEQKMIGVNGMKIVVFHKR
jgi:CRP/FNR family cyclic AMP-dependent transcriptional regulator